MPQPHASNPRDRTYLLRMTADEDDFVRTRAVRDRKSINATLAGLIQEAMEREQTPTPPPAAPPATPPPAPTPQRPFPPPPARQMTAPKKKRPRGSVGLTWREAMTDNDPGHVPGQEEFPEDR